jgi:flagellar basal body-associated protein FliL
MTLSLVFLKKADQIHDNKYNINTNDSKSLSKTKYFSNSSSLQNLTEKIELKRGEDFDEIHYNLLRNQEIEGRDEVMNKTTSCPQQENTSETIYWIPVLVLILVLILVFSAIAANFVVMKNKNKAEKKLGSESESEEESDNSVSTDEEILKFVESLDLVFIDDIEKPQEEVGSTLEAIVKLELKDKQ